MILGQISWLDCFAFLVFLAPQLLIHVGLFKTAICGVRALPYLVLIMPFQLIRERYFTKYEKKSPFVQHCTLFQDVVMRCVRYAFANIPASIGRVFLSKGVAYPFFRFRMLRHGILQCPIYWKEVQRDGFKGVYMVHDTTRRPDVLIYYCHGGGFSMGSSFFYIEFLMAWISLLHSAGYANPALVALEYTLVPDGTYPTQVQETLAGYKYALSIVDDPSRICVSGDSAGATLTLSLLLCLSNYSSLKQKLPGLAVLISPWTTILSPRNRNTASDYLDVDSLRLYGTQYIGQHGSSTSAIVSPGTCQDKQWWRKASPTEGWMFIYGAEEVFAPDTRDMIEVLQNAGVRVREHEEDGWVHAWPVVKLFLSTTQEERQSGIKAIVGFIRERIEPSKSQ